MGVVYRGRENGYAKKITVMLKGEKRVWRGRVGAWVRVRCRIGRWLGVRMLHLRRRNLVKRGRKMIRLSWERRGGKNGDAG